MEVCPLAKTGKELILDLVNQENATTIAEEQLIFGLPEAGAEDGNTRLNLKAAPDSPWNNEVNVDFDRLDLLTVFNGQRAEISAPKGATPSDIICHLNFTYGTKFDVSEFDVTPIEDGELPEVYAVKAKADNLAYTGQFEIFVDLERMPLAARILVTDLDGFGYPNSDVPSPNNPISATLPTRSLGSSYYNAYTKDYGDLKLRIELEMGGNTPPRAGVTVLDRTDGVQQMAWRYSNQGSSTASVTVTATKDGATLTNRQILDDYDVSIIDIGSLGEGPEMKLRLAETVNNRAPFKSDDGLQYPFTYYTAAASTFSLALAVDLGGGTPPAGSYAQVVRERAGVGFRAVSGGGSSAYSYRYGPMKMRVKLKHRRNANKPAFFIDLPVNFTLA